MDTYTQDTSDFEEDATPPWRAKQLADDAFVEEQLAAPAPKSAYAPGDEIGPFRYVRPMKYKNRAIFECIECGKQFQYNIHGIRNKKRCKWYKKHKG